MWNKSKKYFILLSGPSGVGKSTIVKNILSLYPDKMGTLVSYTTRVPRGAEKEATDYHFISKKEFLSFQKIGFFTEWAYVYGHYYGTAKNQISQHWTQGKVIIKDFDLQGAKAIKKIYPQSLSVFISPPNIKELEKRIQTRKENNTEDISMRLQQVPLEMQQIALFDHHLKNELLSETIQKLKKIIAEYLK